jgi:lipopolysaccharide export system protein LptC
MNWRGVLMMVLLAGAILSAWSVWKHRSAGARATVASGRSDYVLHDFELVSLDRDGKEAFTLRAPKLQQTPGAKTMDLTTPLFLLPDEHGHYWQVRSRAGWVSAARDRIRLHGNVRTTSPREDAREVTMTTKELNVFPNTKRASSPAVVTITQPGSILRGRGLVVELDSKRYVLKSQVRARYASSLR